VSPAEITACFFGKQNFGVALFDMLGNAIGRVYFESKQSERMCGGSNPSKKKEESPFAKSAKAHVIAQVEDMSEMLERSTIGCEFDRDGFNAGLVENVDQVEGAPVEGAPVEGGRRGFLGF
jgi:hypothetical protein